MSGLTPPWYFQQFSKPNGAPLDGGKLYFYVAGSTTLPKSIYSDIGKTNLIAQPLVLDAGGAAEQYFMEDGLYKVVIQDSAGVEIASRDNIAGGGVDAGGSVPGIPGIASISSFPEKDISWWSDPADQVFRTDGCFCWIVAANTINSIKWFKTISGRNATFPTGKVSIWGGSGFGFSGGDKLAEFNLPDADTVGVEYLDLDVSAYRWIGVACDPGVLDAGLPVCQPALVLPGDYPYLSPRFYGYVGQHTHNTSFAAFPPIYAADTKYMSTRWMELGVIYKESA
jgi:hypothetical protein